MPDPDHLVVRDVKRPPPLTALFLADFSPIPARVMSAWLDAGHRVAEVWTSAQVHHSMPRRDRRLGWLGSPWSLSRSIGRHRLRHRLIGRMSDPAVAQALAALDIDLVICVHFPLILPKAVLARLRGPAINLHPALLPAYRGPTPLLSLLLDGAVDVHGGVTAHRIIPEIDAGPIFGQARVPLPEDRNPRRWELDLGRAAARLVLAVAPDVVVGTNQGTPQDAAGASYRRVNAADIVVTPSMTGARIDWLTATVGRLRPLPLEIEGRRYPISGVVRPLGPASGRPARIGWSTIDLDLADGRYRLRRRPFWEGRRLRWSMVMQRAWDRG